MGPFPRLPGCALLVFAFLAGVWVPERFTGRERKGNKMNLEIVYLSPHDLKPYEGNTRKHNPEDIDGIKKSIMDVGFADPIGIWGKDNLIVEGHGRQLAAIELGLEKVPCIRLDEMTDEQRREYAIRHNRSAEMSAWDLGKLEEELARLDIEGVDMSDLKFSHIDETALDDLFAPAEAHGKEPKRIQCPHCGEWFEP